MSELTKTVIETLASRHQQERDELYNRLEASAQKSSNVKEGDIWAYRGDIIEIKTVYKGNFTDVMDKLTFEISHLMESRIIERGRLIYRRE